MSISLIKLEIDIFFTYFCKTTLALALALLAKEPYVMNKDSWSHVQDKVLDFILDERPELHLSF